MEIITLFGRHIPTPTTTQLFKKIHSKYLNSETNVAAAKNVSCHGRFLRNNLLPVRCRRHLSWSRQLHALRYPCNSNDAHPVHARSKNSKLVNARPLRNRTGRAGTPQNGRRTRKKSKDPETQDRHLKNAECVWDRHF